MTTLLSDNELLEAFESCSLSHDRWNHLAHVRVAFLYASRHDPDAATDRMRVGIRRLNAATQTPESLDRGYHETITSAFMRLVASATRQSPRLGTSLEFGERFPELLNKDALRDYYSDDRLRNWGAKRRFVEPNLAPLPRLFGETTTVAQVTTARHVEQSRELFLEYARSLDFTRCFQNFEQELATLPGNYAAPGGRLLLVYRGGQLAGCVGLRQLGDGCHELKRMWVRPTFRGGGLGRLLVQSVIEEGRRLRATALRLDTVASMEAAIGLYQSLGFVSIAPYTNNPVAGAVCFELLLA